MILVECQQQLSDGGQESQKGDRKQAIYGLRTSCSWGFPVLKKRKFGTRKMDGAAGKLTAIRG
jgi:hypothetical protein